MEQKPLSTIFRKSLFSNKFLLLEYQYIVPWSISCKIATPQHKNCSHGGSLKLIQLLSGLPTNSHELHLIMLFTDYVSLKARFIYHFNITVRSSESFITLCMFRMQAICPLSKPIDLWVTPIFLQ